MDLQSLELKRDRLIFDASAILKTAEREGRGLTDPEKSAYDQLLEKDLVNVKTAITNLTRDRDQQDAVTRFTTDPESMGLTRLTDAVHQRLGHVQQKSVGQQFIASDAWRWITKTKAERAGTWRSPGVELKTTLGEDPATGGALIVPTYVPGIVPSPTRPIVVSDLFAKGPTSSNAVVFMEESSYTNAAAPVAEGGSKPQSMLTFVAVTAPVRKVAHWLPVSDELLEDEAAMGAYLDARLRLGVALAVDNQLLNGSGVAPELLGLLVRSDLTAPLPKGAATAIDAIAAQISLVEQASQLPVDSVVLNPADWLKLALSKATTGEYIGASPFETPTTPTLFGRRVAQTVLMPVGTAAVGAFATGGGMLFQRGGIRVEASNAHQDFFTKNLVAILAEVRVALAIFRPTGFGLITGL